MEEGDFSGDFSGRLKDFKLENLKAGRLQGFEASTNWFLCASFIIFVQEFVVKNPNS